MAGRSRKLQLWTPAVRAREWSAEWASCQDRSYQNYYNVINALLADPLNTCNFRPDFWSKAKCFCLFCCWGDLLKCLQDVDTWYKWSAARFLCLLSSAASNCRTLTQIYNVLVCHHSDLSLPQALSQPPIKHKILLAKRSLYIWASAEGCAYTTLRTPQHKIILEWRVWSLWVCDVWCNVRIAA